jgi:hypothetical protein
VTEPSPEASEPSPEAIEYLRRVLRRTIFQMVRELNEFDRTVCQLAFDAGEDPLLYDEPDGTIRVEFAGIVLGHVVLSRS